MVEKEYEVSIEEVFEKFKEDLYRKEAEINALIEENEKIQFFDECRLGTEEELKKNLYELKMKIQLKDDEIEMQSK